jgi:hypothetical protein
VRLALYEGRIKRETKVAVSISTLTERIVENIVVSLTHSSQEPRVRTRFLNFSFYLLTFLNSFLLLTFRACASAGKRLITQPTIIRRCGFFGYRKR